MDKNMIQMIATEIGAKHGYSEVTVELSRFKDFKAKWVRTSNWIHIMISDYIRDAPEEVFSSILDTLMYRMEGTISCYSQEVADYFNGLWRAGMTLKYLGRHKDTLITDSDLGFDRDSLPDYVTLVFRHGIRNIESSTIFKVIAIPEDTDLSGLTMENLQVHLDKFAEGFRRYA